MHESSFIDPPLAVTTGIGEPARAILVRHERDLERAFLALRLSMGPTVLLLGGAGKIAPAHASRLRPFFERTVVPAIAALGAAVVTGGTDAGVMRSIGSANLVASTRVRLIGVAPFAKVRVTGSDGTTPLARGHGDFVLTPGADWGDESRVLDALARRLGGPRPPVLLVNGGEIALAEVARARAGGSHVIVAAGSGRAADEIAARIRADASMSEHDTTVIELDDEAETLARALRRSAHDQA